MSEAVKRIDIAEFRDFGYLQEVNRLFFHPHGLALEVLVDDDGNVTGLGGVWDYRDDPEGINYAKLDLIPKASRVADEWERRKPARVAALGYMIQPPEDTGALVRYSVG